ncbi:MAG: LuxR C-terminal-related transcriptional regulator [Muribaculaceae bacterium]|nr:LuxR C-terminal-related transcriptional regulator [Muribaculaceae bacterium]
MRDLIRHNNHLLPVISRFDIAFGFGDSTVRDVCRDNNVDTDTFLNVCNFLSGHTYEVADISLPSLMGYLRHAHSSFLEVTLPKIRLHLLEAVNHAATDRVALLFIKFFDDYVAEVRRHMEHENEVSFKYVDALLAGEPVTASPMPEFSVNHPALAAKLNELKDIFIYHYKQRDNDRLSAALFDIMVCERDLTNHFEVENELFVPAVHALEETRRAAAASAPAGAAAESDATALSPREKDIVRLVAQGKGNKEIADRLRISTHTVATHRRNISSKLDIHSGAGLTIYAIINGLVDLPDSPNQ